MCGAINQAIDVFASVLFFRGFFLPEARLRRYRGRRGREGRREGVIGDRLFWFCGKEDGPNGRTSVCEGEGVTQREREMKKIEERKKSQGLHFSLF